MNIELCKQEIKRHEGELLEVYVDSLGYKTLGVGHLIQPQDPEHGWEVGTPITQEVSDIYFEDDFNKHLAEAIHVCEKNNVDFENLPDAIQRVLVNMCFNLGGSRLGKFKNMLYACATAQWQEMANQMEDSKWFRQVGRRSKELKELVLGEVK